MRTTSSTLLYYYDLLRLRAADWLLRRILSLLHLVLLLDLLQHVKEVLLLLTLGLHAACTRHGLSRLLLAIVLPHHLLKIHISVWTLITLYHALMLPFL